MQNGVLRKQLAILICRLYSQSYYIPRTSLYGYSINDGMFNLYYSGEGRNFEIHGASEEELLHVFDHYFKNDSHKLNERDAALLKKCRDIYQLGSCFDKLLTEER